MPAKKLIINYAQPSENGGRSKWGVVQAAVAVLFWLYLAGLMVMAVMFLLWHVIIKSN